MGNLRTKGFPLQGRNFVGHVNITNGHDFTGAGVLHMLEYMIFILECTQASLRKTADKKINRN
jgi:hypothetical protein